LTKKERKITFFIKSTRALAYVKKMLYLCRLFCKPSPNPPFREGEEKAIIATAARSGNRSMRDKVDGKKLKDINFKTNIT